MTSLHNSKDFYSLGYLGLTSLVFTLHWWIGPSYLLTFISCAQAYGVGCILHNQVHKPMWKSAGLNSLTEFWIHLLRGDGCYSWIPTHVLNHHRFENRPGDLTLTYKYGHKNNGFEFILYTLRGTVAYISTGVSYLISLAQRKPSSFLKLALQIGTHGALLFALSQVDFNLTLWVLIIPQIFGFVAMIGTGYMQHQHTCESSKFNHSRNFVGRLNNLLHFNHGYHTVHHINPKQHWSDWPQSHQDLAHHIHPELNQPSLPFYFLKLFVLQHLSKKFKTINFRNSTHLLSDFENCDPA